MCLVAGGSVPVLHAKCNHGINYFHKRSLCIIQHRLFPYYAPYVSLLQQTTCVPEVLVHILKAVVFLGAQRNQQHTTTLRQHHPIIGIQLVGMHVSAHENLRRKHPLCLFGTCLCNKKRRRDHKDDTICTLESQLFACEINNRFVNEKYDMVVPGFRFVLACVPFPMAIVALNISYTLMLTLTRTSITTVCPMQTRKDKDYIDGNQFYTMHLKQLSLLTVKISSNM